MKRHISIVTLLTLVCALSYGQTPYDIDMLLTALYNTKDAKELSTKPVAKKIIGYGDKILPILANHFTDTTATEIKSACQNLMLTRGEVAIILADRIELMPYMRLTNIENCILAFCDDNPNFIEYYLYAIRRDSVKKFQDRYIEWLASKDRKKWNPYLNNRKKRAN